MNGALISIILGGKAFQQEDDTSLNVNQKIVYRRIRVNDQVSEEYVKLLTS